MFRFGRRRKGKGKNEWLGERAHPREICGTAVNMGMYKNLGYVLICSNQINDVYMLRGLLQGNGYNVQTCNSFYTLMSQIKRQIPSLIIFDRTLTPKEIEELCLLREQDAYVASMQVMGIVPQMDFEYENSLYACHVDNVIYSPFNSTQVMRRVGDSFERSVYLEEKDGFEKLLFSLTSAYDARETSNAGHPERVANAARRLGKRLGMSEEDQIILYKGGMLHDIGMVKVPRDILEKHGVLDNNEYEIVKTHTVWGERLCSRVRSLEKVLPLIRHHHEQIDGSGYPDGLKGDQIPEKARVMAICEMFDALSCDRPYRPRLSRERVIKVLEEYAERNWLDKEFVAEFVKMLAEGELEQ